MEGFFIPTTLQIKKRFMEVKIIKGGKEKVYYMNEY